MAPEADALDHILRDLVMTIRSFETSDDATPKGPEDFVTSWDRMANDFLIERLREVTPNLPVRSEEDGQPADMPADGGWIVDPVDGSQNVAVNLPIAGSAVCLTDGHSTSLAGVARFWPPTVLVADAAGDARMHRFDGCDWAPVPLAGMTDQATVDRVCLLRGSSRRSPEFTRAEHGLGLRYSRVYQTRCPVVDLLLLVEGGARALVCFDLTGYETLPVLFLAAGLGFAVRITDPTPVAPWQVPRAQVIAREWEIDDVLSALTT